MFRLELLALLAPMTLIIWATSARLVNIVPIGVAATLASLGINLAGIYVGGADGSTQPSRFRSTRTFGEDRYGQKHRPPFSMLLKAT